MKLLKTLFVPVSATVFVIAASPVLAEQAVTESLVVNAKPDVVFKSIQKMREAPGHHLKSYDGKQAVVEEQWTGLPLIGSADCVYKEIEESENRIDYSLVSSDKLKKFEGCWVLTPVEGGKKTKVELVTTTDTGLKLPFAGKLTQMSTAQRAECRLEALAKAAESLQAHAGAEACR